MGSSPLPLTSLPFHLTSQIARSSVCRLIGTKSPMLIMIFLAAFLLLPGITDFISKKRSKPIFILSAVWYSIHTCNGTNICRQIITFCKIHNLFVGRTFSYSLVTVCSNTLPKTTWKYGSSTYYYYVVQLFGNDNNKTLIQFS